MEKSPEAFRTISEVADWLGVPTHVLRFWESRFNQIKPVKRAGGRRYYRPSDMALIGGIKRLLHDDGMTIRGAQKLLREKGIKHVAGLSQPLDGGAAADDTIIEAEVVETSPATPVAAPVAAEPPATEPAVPEREAPAPEAPGQDAPEPAFATIEEVDAEDPEDDDTTFGAVPGIAARLRLVGRAQLQAHAPILRDLHDRIASGGTV